MLFFRPTELFRFFGQSSMAFPWFHSLDPQCNKAYTILDDTYESSQVIH